MSELAEVARRWRDARAAAASRGGLVLVDLVGCDKDAIASWEELEFGLPDAQREALVRSRQAALANAKRATSLARMLVEKGAPGAEGQRARAAALRQEARDIAERLGLTCTGEEGIGDGEVAEAA